MVARGWLAVPALCLALTVRPAATLPCELQSSPRQDGPRLDKDGELLPPGALLRIGTARLRPSGMAQALAFTADSGRLVTIDMGTGAHVWDVAAGKELLAFGRLAGREAPYAVSANGKWAALIESANVCRVYDATTGREFRAFRGDWAKTRKVCLSRDGRLLAAAGEDIGIRVWEVAGQNLVRQWEGHKGGDGRSMRLAFSPDGKKVALGTRASPVFLGDVDSGQQVSAENLVGADGALVFSPDGKVLAAVANEWQHFTLWDAGSEKPLQTFALDHGSYWCVGFTPDGKSVATGNFPGSVSIWDTATGKLRRTLKGHPGEVESLAFSPNGKLLALGSGGCTVRIWDVQTGQERHVFAGAHAALVKARFTTDGNAIASICNPWYHHKSSEGSTLRLWDPARGTALRQVDWDTEKVAAACLSADGRLLASASKDAKLRVQNLATEKDGPALRAPRWPITALELSGDGRYLAAKGWDSSGPRNFEAAHPAIQVWDLVDGRTVLAITSTDAGPMTCHFADNGPYLAVYSASSENAVGIDAGSSVGSRAGHIRFWDLRTGQKVLRAGPPLAVEGLGTFSPSGRLMALWDDHGDGLVLCEVGTGRPVVRPDIGAKSTCLAFSPDGRAVAVGTREGDIVLWDFVSALQLTRLTGHRGSGQSGGVASVAFSPDGKRLLSGGDDTTMIVWDVSPWAAKIATPVLALDPAAAARLWDDLATADAPEAYRAVGRYVRSPKEALAFLRRHLQPVPPAETKKIALWIENLDSPRYADREQATAKLQKLGNQALPALDRVLSTHPTLEVRRRAELLLSRMENQSLPAPWLQALRGLEVLELLGNADAVDLLDSLTRGAPEAWLTQEAEATLERVKKRISVAGAISRPPA